MFTPEFKATIAAVCFLLAVGALLFNQFILRKEIIALQHQPLVKTVVVIATPSATLVPTKPVKYTAPVKTVVPSVIPTK